MKSKCGLVLPDNVLFCPACGEKLSPPPGKAPEVEGVFGQMPSGGAMSRASQLADLLQGRSGRPRPSVPPDWSKRPGILSGRFGRLNDPWGNFGDARALFAHGMVAEGRELIARIMQATERTPHFGSAVAAYCFDLIRPPAEASRANSLLSLCGPSEALALKSLMAHDRGDADEGLSSLMDSMKGSHRFEHDAFIWLMAWLAWSDTFLQVQILHPLGRVADSAIVIAPLKGQAQLMLRQPEHAWGTFQGGLDKAERAINTYRDTLRVDIPGDLEAKLSRMFRAYCNVGLALVLWDLCFDSEAKAAARDVARSLDGFPQQACRALAGIMS